MVGKLEKTAQSLCPLTETQKQKAEVAEGHPRALQLCVCWRVYTGVALLRVSVHDHVGYRSHDLLDQTIRQRGHPLMIVLHTHTNTRLQNVRPRSWTSRLTSVVFTSISCWEMLHAAPRPTARGVGTVPERSPLSCPPPFCSGSRRTRGRRRTYRAPTPARVRQQVEKKELSKSRLFYLLP